jgi:60 kDa SS-A/Ro ribonucleoprotein
VEASAAMAVITAATEPEPKIIAFFAGACGCGGMHRSGEPGINRLNLSPRMRLAEVIKRIEAIPMGDTDRALPPLCAARNKLNVSGFIIYTDSETWAEVKAFVGVVLPPAKRPTSFRRRES